MDSVTTKPQNPSGFFAISPKLDCPHEHFLQFERISSDLKKGLLQNPCNDCEVTQENWMCLECSSIGCSRYFNSHMVKHNETTNHTIALSFSDGSFWCYSCDSYIHSKALGLLAKEFSSIKFPETTGLDAAISSLANGMSNLSTNDTKKEKVVFTREQFIKGLKDKTFKKILFLTGAGISVSSGIPDFRSPKTGLYDNLAAYNLPRPEAVFELAYFKKQPEAFYKVMKGLFGFKPKPVISHKFIKMVADENTLLLNLTQNIDGLEVEAGLDPKYLVEAHGTSRTVHCLSCQKEGSREEFFKHLQDQIIYKCECGGLMKPDIIFFGEAMPESFFKSLDIIDKADMVIVMGTSLKVYPFAAIIPMIPQNVPVIYINRENTAIKRDNFLFMEGDIDEQVDKLIKDLEWDAKLKQFEKPEDNAKL